MKRQQILERPALMLTQVQRGHYFDHGYVGAPAVIGQGWLDRLNECTARYVDESRGIEPGGDKRFDLEPDHTAATPRIRRLNSPVDVDGLYWEFAATGPFVDIAEDLLGPDIKFHHSKLNFKWSGGGEEVKWHQDIQFWPHTNYDVLTIGVYLDDVSEQMAPMGVIPGSHDGPLYNLYDHDSNWTGCIRDEDVPAIGAESASYLDGPAGTVTVHNCRSIHGSPPNWSEKPRPLLLCAYSAGDAFPITNLVSQGQHGDEVVRGERSMWARFDGRPCLMPPDWSKAGGAKSIFQHQQHEESGSSR
ncbi:MAG: phytanoyl-CoA dioxygenase family protein [Gammaproteobacteria bacterium]|nr:phytanoyl-CoA dioxygenase family protein [Gammaproteobacteria bacterium]